MISCERDWDCVDKRVRVIEVSDGCCNEEGLTELDLSGFVNLRGSTLTPVLTDRPF